MIKIDIDTCIFEDGDRRGDGEITIRGDSDNLEMEIYAILKTFESKCTEPYLKAIERIVEGRRK